MRHLRILFLALLSACSAAPPPIVAPRPPAWTDSVVLMLTNEARCSAVLITPRTALTARHCTETALRGVLVRGTHEYAIESVVQYADRDVSVLSLAEDIPGAYAHEAQNLPRAGDRAIVVGFGCDYPARGVRSLTSLGRSSAGLTFAGRVCGGDSGGGVFNEDGDLVGITTARNGSSTLAFGAGLQ